mmetsp:Transcript_61407/g.180135  ORF Transcript_61407/g.180135 Transcript_61407/m.180135 type:complete len:254 (-) Transcript_61407:1119-1880(-)
MSSGRPMAPRYIRSSYSVPQTLAAPSAASHHSLRCSQADWSETKERQAPPTHSLSCRTTSALLASAASSGPPAASAAPQAPEQSASREARDAVGRRVLRRWRRRCRASGSRAASFAQRSSRRAARILGATRWRSLSTSWKAPAPPVARGAHRAPLRRSALAPYLERAPLRKAAWVAESFVRSASISASWFRSSLAPWRHRTAALCCAMRDCGPARARRSLSAPGAARCSSSLRSRAAVQRSSCSSAGRALVSP